MSVWQTLCGSQPWAIVWRMHVSGVLSMDMMGYSYSLKAALSRIAAILGDEAGSASWAADADQIARTTTASLWREDRGAMFDRFADDSWVPTLQHNNLRMVSCSQLSAFYMSSVLLYCRCG